MQVLQDGLPVTDITPGSADPYTPGFALVPAPSAAPRARLPGPWLQFMADGVALGDPDIAIVDIVIDASLVTVTRGVGENSHVITIKKPDLLPPDSCPNGPLWTERVASSSKRWTGVVFGATAGFCVAGGLNTVSTRPAAMYSIDYGVSWTESPTAFPDTSGYGFAFGTFAFGGGVYLGALNAAQMARSTDGINWSIVSSPAIASAAKMEFGGGVFAYVRSSSDQLYTSPDGLSWTPRTLPSSATWGGIGYGNSTWIVTNGAGGTARSLDGGATWAAGGALPTPYVAHSLAYGNGTWVATIVNLETRLAYSTDNGLTWQFTAALQGSTTSWQRVRFIAGIFYVANAGGLACYKSADGITWTAASSFVNMSPSFSIEWAGDDVSPFHYVAVGNAGSATTITNSGVCG